MHKLRCQSLKMHCNQIRADQLALINDPFQLSSEQGSNDTMIIQLPPSLRLDVCAFLTTADIVMRIGLLNTAYHSIHQTFVRCLEWTEKTLSNPQCHPSQFANLRRCSLTFEDRVPWEKMLSSLLRCIAATSGIRSLSVKSRTEKTVKLRPAVWQVLSKMGHLESLVLVDVHPYASADSAFWSCIESLMRSLRTLILSRIGWTGVDDIIPRLRASPLEVLRLDASIHTQEQAQIIVRLLTKLPELKEFRYNNLFDGVRTVDRVQVFHTVCQQMSNTIARYNPHLVIFDVGINSYTMPDLLDPDRENPWNAGRLSVHMLPEALFIRENRYRKQANSNLLLRKYWNDDMTDEERRAYELRVPKAIEEARRELEKCHTVKFLMSKFPPQTSEVSQ
eukprot:GILK01012572.1.p1 GENE.GILK01012572.1~~GILK01012572.1.p1  ORF type:complete len:392 (-),score=35.28 GILK01012572.1:437-1612(-)